MAELLVNRPPAITWHRLRVNGTALELPGAAPADTADGRGWLAANAGDAQRVEFHAGDEGVRHVDIEAGAGEVTVRAVEVVAHAGAVGSVVVHVDGVGTDGAAPESSVAGVAIRVTAEAGSQVDLRVLQTLDAGFTYLEDVELTLDAGARVAVNQTVLGGSASFVNTGAALSGDAAQADIDVRYLGRGDARLDFNYALRQTGRETRVRLNANGILADEARKTFRDTIDLVHGCKGASGTEQETVLILGDGAGNISLPVILCDEDDVQGDHGVTVGHVNPTQMAYLASRGLDEEQAETLFFGALFDLAAAQASTDRARDAIERLRTQLRRPA